MDIAIETQNVTLTFPQDVLRELKVIAARRGTSIAVLWSEHLNHGQTYEGVRVQNPFAVDNER